MKQKKIKYKRGLPSVSKFKSELKNQQGNNTKSGKMEGDDLEKLKNELVSMISHRVRTPLTIIKEGLSLVLDEIPGKLNPKQKKFLGDVKRNADRLVQSVEEILQTAWYEIVRSR